MQNLPMFARQGGKVYIRRELVSLFPRSGRLYLDYRGWWLNDKYSAGFLRALTTADLELLPAKVGKREFRDLRYSDSDIAKILEPRITMLGLGYSVGLNNYESKGRQYNHGPFKAKCAFAKELLRGVRISSLHWQDMDYSIFNEQDFLYFDPPYFGESTTYGEISHTALLKLLTAHRFKWLVSGYDCELYRSYLGLPALEITRGGHMVTMARAAKVQITKREAVWANYPLTPVIGQLNAI